MIPTTYNFPSLGVLLSLSFMFFAGWFIGSPVPVSSYPGFLPRWCVGRDVLGWMD